MPSLSVGKRLILECRRSSTQLVEKSVRQSWELQSATQLCMQTLAGFALCQVLYLDIVGGIQRESVVDAFRQHNHVTLFHGYPDPLLIQIPHIKIACMHIPLLLTVQDGVWQAKQHMKMDRNFYSMYIPLPSRM